MIKNYFKLAIINLSHRKLRSWLTMLGIFIGVALIVSLISLGGGMRKAIEAQFQSLGADRIIIQAKGNVFGPPGQTSAVKITNKDLKAVENSNGVEIAAGRLLRQGKIDFNDNSKFIYVASLPNEKDKADFLLTSLDMEAEYGRMLKPSDSYKVVVGSNYLDKKYFGKPLSVGRKIKIQGVFFEVVGIMKRTGSPQFDGAFLLNEEDEREIFNLKKENKNEEEYSLIVAKVLKGADVNAVVETIKKNLRKERNVKEKEEDFTVETAENVISSVNSILGMVQFVLVGIATISIIVGGIGITNTMYTSVLERVREIGIMKAVGARNSDIFYIFFIESGLLGIAGASIGVILGIGMSKAVEVISFQALKTSLIQANISFSLILGTIFFGFLIGAVSGTLPAINASRMQPTEAIRE